MATTTTNLWLYLARRDSKGIRILTIMRGRPLLTTRVTDLSVLQLPQAWQVEVQQIIDDERMMWEPFIESSDDYQTLKATLKKRGYTNLPLNGEPEFFRGDITPPLVNVGKLPKQSTMLRRA